MGTLSPAHRDAVAMGLAPCVAMVTPSPAHMDDAVAIETGSAHLVAMVTLSPAHRDAVAMGIGSMHCHGNP